MKCAFSDKASSLPEFSFHFYWTLRRSISAMSLETYNNILTANDKDRSWRKATAKAFIFRLPLELSQDIFILMDTEDSEGLRVLVHAVRPKLCLVWEG